MLQLASQRRITRRRALSSTAALAGGAAFLAACGGGDSASSGSGRKDASGLLTQPADSSSQATRGGTAVRFQAQDPTGLDPYLTQSLINGTISRMVWSRMLQPKPGVLKASDNSLVGDAAESWEWSPDKTQLTLKIRPGVRFHPIAPVDGREMTSDDVLFSWRKLTQFGTARREINSVDPQGVILSMTAPDSKTIVIKLKEPISYLEDLLGQNFVLSLMPKEAEGGYDARQQIIGSGPFMLRKDDWVPSSRMTFRRNPGYWDRGRPFLDAVAQPVITEYATGTAQLKSGQILSYDVRQEDVIRMKSETPALGLYEGDILDFRSWMTWFGNKPASNPFRDERIRQAFSMALDRDLFIDTLNNVPEFEKAGLPVEKRWSTVIPQSLGPEGGWLDPRGKDFGPNAAYFQYNPAESKKLMAAAGLPNGFTSRLWTTGFASREIVITYQMYAEVGLKVEPKEDMDLTVYQRDILYGRGNFDGISHTFGPAPPSPTATGFLSHYFWTGGTAFFGFDANGRGDGSGDPQIETEVLKARRELDTAKRTAITNDLQRYISKKAYAVRMPGGATNYLVAWPALRNFRAFRSNIHSFSNLNEWLDNSLPPFK